MGEWGDNNVTHKGLGEGEIKMAHIFQPKNNRNRMEVGLGTYTTQDEAKRQSNTDRATMNRFDIC